MLTQQRLKELLSYDDKTGVFMWNMNRGNIKSGSIAGFIRNDGYRAIKIDRKQYLAHRLVWLYVHGKFPSNDIDHKNGSRDDNSLSNLRSANRIQNCINRSMQNNNTSGYKGVSKSGNVWMAKLCNKYIGRFKTKEAAYSAYAEAAKEKFGEFSPCQI